MGGWWASAETTNVTSNFSSSDCSASSDTSASTSQTTQLEMVMDCSFEFIGMHVVPSTVVCPDGKEMTPNEAMQAHTRFKRDCNQVATLDIKMMKDTTSKFTAACLQDAKNETKQKSESVVGLSLPGTSASASNYNSSISAQRAQTLSSFYTMSSQKTSVKMLLDAHTTIANSDMDACSMRMLMDSIDVKANQSVSITASMDDRVSTDTAMTMQQYNSNTTDQTAVAKVEVSFMWLILLVIFFLVVVMIGPIFLRLAFSVVKGSMSVVGGVMKGTAMAAAGAASSVGNAIHSPQAPTPAVAYVIPTMPQGTQATTLAVAPVVPPMPIQPTAPMVVPIGPPMIAPAAVPVATGI
jgi:hypothetical protein